jgi:hypothetical protein
MFQNPVLRPSPGGNLSDGPLRKSYLQSLSTVVSSTDQDVSKTRSCLWRVTRHKVQGSSFYEANQIGLHLRTEAQSDPTKCLIIQQALGKLQSMNCTSKYTPSSQLYRTLADPFHQ